MLYFFTPYSINKKLFEAYDACMALIGKDDWACFLDGDTCFFESNFGHQVQGYIDKYPDTGIFTSYASRSSYHYMVPKDTLQESDSITYHRKRSREILTRYPLHIKEINEHIAGHLMCIKRSTWDLIRQQLLKVVDGANLLGVDTQISNQVRNHGLKIRLMRSIYLFHYYRLVEGRKFKEHLMDQKINVLIRTSNRENLFKRCIDSVRCQTYKDINIEVSADDEKTIAYVRKYGIEPVIVRKRPKTSIETAPYNAYLNDLMARVKGGWIFFLDDDDYLANNTVMESVVKYLTDDNVIYFMKMRWTTGRIIPSNENFAMGRIVLKDIGMPCFIFHAKHKHRAGFDYMKQGDFRFITKLASVVKRHRWIDLIVTQIGNTGAYGKP